MITLTRVSDYMSWQENRRSTYMSLEKSIMLHELKINIKEPPCLWMKAWQACNKQGVKEKRSEIKDHAKS